MTEKELKMAKKLETRIKELDTEIMALFDAKGLKINPFKPFKIYNYSSKEIELTHLDIRVLQDVRSQEKQYLQKLLDEL